MDHIPDELWNTLIDVAKKDGIITNDEDALLDTIQIELQKFYKKMLQSEGNKDPKKMLRTVLEKAHDQALKDDKISNDEAALMHKLKIILDKIKEEMK